MGDVFAAEIETAPGRAGGRREYRLALAMIHSTAGSFYLPACLTIQAASWICDI